MAHGFFTNAEEGPVRGLPIAKVNWHELVWDVFAVEEKAGAGRQEQAGPGRCR